MWNLWAFACIRRDTGVLCSHRIGMFLRKGNQNGRALKADKKSIIAGSLVFRVSRAVNIVYEAKPNLDMIGMCVCAACSKL